VPLSLCAFLALYRRSALPMFVALSALALGVACAFLYGLYGPKIFSALLFPRQYSLEDAWDQTKDQLVRYNFFLLVIPYLALNADPGARLILVYLFVSFVEGAVFSGGADVDVNVFFDFAIGISIALGLLQDTVRKTLADDPDPGRRASTLALWLSITLIPLLLDLRAGFDEARLAATAIADDPQRADIQSIRSAAGPVVCADLALCYWAGKDFAVDLNNLQMLVRAMPALEAEFVARIKRCSYSLIQLGSDWDGEDGSLTEAMQDALTAHYAQARTGAGGIYWRPEHCENSGSR